MSEMISENWILFLLLLVVFIVIIWWLFARSGTDHAQPDVQPPTSKELETPKKMATPIPEAPKISESPKKESIATKKAAKPKAKARPSAPKSKPVPPKTAPAKPETQVPAKPKEAPKPKTSAKPAIADNLELLKGVGPKLKTLLESLGVTSLEQVANWNPADIREIDSKLGTFAGRIGRDNWVDQATLLSKGDIAGFEKKYGALGSDIK